MNKFVNYILLFLLIYYVLSFVPPYLDIQLLFIQKVAGSLFFTGGMAFALR